MPGKVWTSAKRRRARSAAAILGTIAFAAPAQPSVAAAADVLDRLMALEQLIETQQRQIETQQRQIDQERAEINALKAQLQASEPAIAEAPRPPAPPEPAVAQAATSPSPEPQVADATFERGRPTIRSRDRRYSLSVQGRLQFDAASYVQDEAGPLSTDWRRGSIDGGRENIAATDLSSGSNFRRAQLGIDGELGRSFHYRLLPEFGGTGEETNPRMHEAWLSYTGGAPWTIKIGAFPPPANLDELRQVPTTFRSWSAPHPPNFRERLPVPTVASPRD